MSLADTIASALRVAQRQTERSPSDAMKEAGNYAKGKLPYKGLTIAIENPKGSERSGVGKDGKRWSVKMPAAYGYVLGSEGYDGDHVDVYLGPDHASNKVFIVDQVNAEDGKFDEHKCLLSYPSRSAALADYEKAFSDGKAKQRIGAVTEMSVDEFKAWVKSGETKKPLGDLRMKRANGGAVTYSRDSLTVSPADEILRGYAEGGVPKGDWRSDVDAPRPHYHPVTGEWIDPDKMGPATLKEGPAPRSMLDAVLDYGAMPAKGFVQSYDDAASSVARAAEDPSIPNLTDAGVRTGMAFFQPMRAAKALGLGLGAAGIQESGLLSGRSAQAEGDGLSPEQAARLKALQRKGTLSRAEREEKNKLTDMQASYARIQAETEAQSRLKKQIYEDEVKAEKEKAALAEYKGAVSNAEKALAEEKAKKPRRFEETMPGQIFDRLGGLAPGVMALGAGALTRGAAGIGKSGAMTDYVYPGLVGGFTGAAMTNVPLGHKVLFEPAENPDRRAYEAYARELPPEHPRKKEWQDYARGLPEENPERRLAVDELYDPIKSAERTGFGAIEGILGGIGGSEAVRILGRAPMDVARAPGRLKKAFDEELGRAPAGGRPQAGSLPSSPHPDSPALQDALSRAEGRRLIGDRSQTGPSGLSAASPGAGPSPASEALSSPALPPPAKRSRPKKDVASDEPKVKRSSMMEDAKKIEEELKGMTPLPSSSDRPMSSWMPADPEVIVKTPRAGGGWYTRREDGRFRGGAVKGKPSSTPSPLAAAMETARRYATGGRVVVGPVVGDTGGRSDELPVSVPPGSHVIPADVVAALGEANTLAGMRALESRFPKSAMPRRATGGEIPVLISDGEFVISPDEVAEMGGGDPEKGHKILDNLILSIRKQHIKTLQSLPGPAKG